MTQRVTRHARRRIGTVNGVEVHQDLTAEELGWPGDWPFSFIKPGEFETRGLGVSRYLTNLSTAKGRRFEFVVRTKDGRIAGALIADVQPEDPTTVRIVWAEAAIPEQGYGTRLVRAFEEWARANGYELVLADSRTAAYQFWVKMGYYLAPETIENIVENRDVYTAFDEASLDLLLEEVEEEGMIPDALFEEHPGALPDPILLEKDLT